LGFFVDIVGRIRSVVNERRPKRIHSNSRLLLYTHRPIPHPVKIFFPTAGGDALLSAEQQTIFKSAELTNRRSRFSRRSSKDPRTMPFFHPFQWRPRFRRCFCPRTARPSSIFQTPFRRITPEEFKTRQATIYSIVDSLTYNLPEIHQVKILIGGTEKETLAGHCLLLLPLEMDLSITNVPPPEQRDSQATAVSGATPHAN